MEQPVFLNATQMDSPVEGIDAVRLGATVLPENPFVGLRPFESKEAVLFFGRKDQTKKLLSILHASRFVAVVGSSGCGKSSLIRAGLIPNLQAGFVAGNVDRWNIITMKPGNSPLQNLATALLRSFQEKPQPAGADALVRDISLYGVSAVTSFLQGQTKGVKTNFLLLVDQFEEIFRFAAYDDTDEKADSEQNKLTEQTKEARREEAADLVSIMLDLVVQESIPAYVVMTMRSDFLGECDAFYGLPEAMNESQYLVPRLTRQQRQQAIEKPVSFYSAEISDRLTDRVLNDLEEERDQLPIMQHALMRTWEKWQVKKEGPLDLPHYIAAGTVAEALSQDADDALKGLPDDELIIAERMFQALTTTDAKGRRLRRPTRLNELAAITGSMPVVRKLIERFRSSNRNFLMLSEDRDPLVDISHESLIRQWATLRKWVDDEAESREMYLRLANDAVRHQANLVPLWSDPALQLALNWWSFRSPTEAWGRRYHKEFQLTEKFLKLSEEKRIADALEVERLKNERIAREQRAAAAFRMRVLALVLVMILAGVSVTAAWALRAQAHAKISAAEANDARSQLQVQQDELKKRRDDLVFANKSLVTEQDKANQARNEAEKARAAAEAASVDAKKQESMAKDEKAKVVLALHRADQVAVADKLRRKAANEENLGEIEDAQATYLHAATAYKQIDDKEGIAYTYFELGNMLSSQDVTATIGSSGRDDRARWDYLVGSNWVNSVLLGEPISEVYFSSIGITKAQAKSLNYYGEAIKAYRESGGSSGLNGVASVLEKVGDFMAINGFANSDDEEALEFAERHHAIATRDSYCMALESLERAENTKRQIALLNKIGDTYEREKSLFRDDSELGGCRNLGNDATAYFTKSVKLYSDLLQKYPHDSNQFKKNRQSFADLLIKVGSLYARRAEVGPVLSDENVLNLAVEKFEKAAEIFRVDGDLENSVNTYKIIADGLREGDLKSKYYQQAAAEYRKAGKFEAEAEFLAAVGRRYYSNGEIRFQDRRPLFEKGIFYLNQALRLYQQQGKLEKYSGLYSSIGFGHLSLLEYPEALEAYQASLSNSLSIGDKKSLPRDYYNLGWILQALGNKTEAKKSYEEVIRVTADDFGNLYRRYAEVGLIRLRGELPPLNAPKTEPSPKAQPSPGASGFIWFGTVLRMLMA